MPPKRKKENLYAKWFIAGTVFISLIGLGYVAYLWASNQRTSFVEYEEFGIPIPTQYGIHGIDVSRYQQRIAWSSVRDMNVRGIQLGFAFIKATEGASRVDPLYKRNWSRAKEAGVVRGAYHFFIPWKDGTLQAQHFMKTVRLTSGDLPPVLDVEQLGKTGSATLKKEIKEWLSLVEAHYGVKPIIYTNADFYKQHLGSDFDNYPLWVAHYLQKHQPRISRKWSFWQHSEQGRVNGISSKVDFNVFNGDDVDFQSLLIP
ncbi:MAG TPA: glycoside hydrolase family 25 protein [Flavisolibacter sp.]